MLLGFRYILIGLLCFLVVGCSSSSTSLRSGSGDLRKDISFSAPVDISAYNSIYVTPIDGNLSIALTEKLRAALRHETDLTVLENLMEGDPALAVFLGYVDGDFGRRDLIIQIDCGERRSKRLEITGRYHFKTLGTKFCLDKLRVGAYSMNGDISLIQQVSDEVIYTHNVAKEIKTRKPTKHASERFILESAAIDSVVLDVISAITPWGTTLYLSFDTDRDLPGLARGVEKIRQKAPFDAIRIFTDIIRQNRHLAESDPELLAKAYWNLGLAYLCTEQYEAAYGALKKAYELSPNARYKKMLDDVEQVWYAYSRREKIKKKIAAGLGKKIVKPSVPVALLEELDITTPFKGEEVKSVILDDDEFYIDVNDIDK